MTAHSAAAGGDVAPEIARSSVRSRTRKPIVALAATLVVAAAGTFWLLAPRSVESTDNAYLQADSTAVAPRIGGLVAAVLVRDNQTVGAGEALVRIDAQDFAARELAAQAAVADADANVAAARAAYAALGSEQALASAQQRSTGTSIAAAEAEFARAASDDERYAELGKRGFATRRDVERFRSGAVDAAAGLERARADIGVASQQVAVIRSRGPVLAAGLAQAQAAALKARAALTLARQERGYTVVHAPYAGVIGNRQVQVGDVVQPGSRLLTLVPQDALYVVANFKETQTRRMRVGQKVRIAVDALDGAELTGAVESFAPGSGSEFTLLPFEPGSGNFTKIVQRVATRIRLDPGQRALHDLRPGLSVTAKVSLR